MCADGRLPSYAVTWCAGQVAGLVLCSACFAGAAVHRTPPCRDIPLFACTVDFVILPERQKEPKQKPPCRPSGEYGTRPVHRNSQAKSVGSACLTCLGNPCSRRRLGTCRRHTVTCELARQGGLPSVRLQPSHGAPSQLRVTTWGPLCCSVCALCNSWSVVYRRAPGTIRYSAGLPTKAGAPCTQSPLPTRNLLGPGKSRAPPPQLFACCCSSQLFPSLVFLVLGLGLGPGPFLPTPSPRPSPPPSPFSTVPPAHTASLSVSRVSVLFSPTPSDRLEDPSPLPD